MELKHTILESVQGGLEMLQDMEPISIATTSDNIDGIRPIVELVSEEVPKILL
jgi:hypothetical protein